MVNLTSLSNYSDAQGNEIVYGGLIDQNVHIKFTGSNNRLVVSDEAKIRGLRVNFDCDNGYMEIGRAHNVPAFSGSVRIGQDSKVLIGENVSSTTTVDLSATEGTTITIGDDVMFATSNLIRADDGHAIYSVRTGKRVNRSKSITIGNHVWLGMHAAVLGGASIGEGSVIGYGSIVTNRIPNNCIAVGVPARVAKRDIAWERPHLSLSKPFYKKDAETVKKSAYWNLTEAEELDKQDTWVSRAKRGGRRILRPLNSLRVRALAMFD
ncbi:acyltransferase [Cryobacterium sp. TMT1-2-1]|uniref:acyltransferase n=1 Tax=Cryobacterium sp. TMT1-2-1 TaxID=1259232 RepID=UPI00106A8CEA|nr:acyltransferase [Cryobacterium sp. TMT1-2-1]TFD45072.1 acyltransferase [Cryobacterium sp. TMT1-2-1]